MDQKKATLETRDGLEARLVTRDNEQFYHVPLMAKRARFQDKEMGRIVFNVESITDTVIVVSATAYDQDNNEIAAALGGAKLRADNPVRDARAEAESHLYTMLGIGVDPALSFVWEDLKEPATVAKGKAAIDKAEQMMRGA